jgi:hypothetical protein
VLGVLVFILGLPAPFVRGDKAGFILGGMNMVVGLVIFIISYVQEVIYNKKFNN